MSLIGQAGADGAMVMSSSWSPENDWGQKPQKPTLFTIYWNNVLKPMWLKFEVLLCRSGNVMRRRNIDGNHEQSGTVAQRGPGMWLLRVPVLTLPLPSAWPCTRFLTSLPWFPGLWNGPTLEGGVCCGPCSGAAGRFACVHEAGMCALRVHNTCVYIIFAPCVPVCLVPGA